MGFNLQVNSNSFVVDWLEDGIEVDCEADSRSNEKEYWAWLVI